MFNPSQRRRTKRLEIIYFLYFHGLKLAHQEGKSSNINTSQNVRNRKNNPTRPELEEGDSNATMDTDTMNTNANMEESNVTTDSQIDINLKTIEEILEELGYLKEGNKELNEKCW